MYFHEGLRHQRGLGLGSLFGSLFRSLMPIAKMGLSAGKKFFRSDLAKKIGSQALDIGKSAASNLAVDLLEGKKFSDSAAEQLDEAKSKIASAIRGGRRKRKNKHTSKRDKNCKKQKNQFCLLED
jgi:hypothetical protein